MEIYIHRDGQDFGPYTRSMVLEHVRQGTFQSSDLGWQTGNNDWVPLSEVLFPKMTLIVPSLHTLPPIPSSDMVRETVRTEDATVQEAATERPPKKKGAAIALITILLLVAVGFAYVRSELGGEMFRRYLSMFASMITVPAKVRTAVPIPAPAIKSASIEKEQVAPVEPTAAPEHTPQPSKSFDPSALARNPAAWPRTVMLKQDVAFPAVYNSKVVGTTIIPRGTLVQLVGIQGNQLNLEYQGGRQTLAWTLTDLEDRVSRSQPQALPAAAITTVTVAAAPSTGADEPPLDEVPPG